MTILALDTTSDQASVALRRDGLILAEEAIVTTDGHSHLLYAIISSVLSKAGVMLADVDCFATASGPGSFTGVRLCMTAAKGLAAAMEKPVAGISNLRALAATGSAALRSPITDARRGQVYTAIYDSCLRLVSAETVVALQDWVTEPEVERILSHVPLASAIAHCAELDGPAGWQVPEALEANYVRRSDAELVWTDA